MFKQHSSNRYNNSAHSLQYNHKQHTKTTMKSSAIFIALVGAVSSNYAAAADHPNMLRGIIPAEEVSISICLMMLS